MRCVAIVRFPAPAALGGERLRKVLEDAVPRYQVIPGLHRKYFLGNDTHGGGVYEWQDRATAQAFYDAAWYERMRTVYGVVPDIQYFDLHAVVDNDGRTSVIDA